MKLFSLFKANVHAHKHSVHALIFIQFNIDVIKHMYIYMSEELQEQFMWVNIKALKSYWFILKILKMDNCSKSHYVW